MLGTTCKHELFITLSTENDTRAVLAAFAQVGGKAVITEVRDNTFGVFFEDRNKGLGFAVELTDRGIAYELLQGELIALVPTMEGSDATKRIITDHLQPCKNAAATA